MLLWQKFCRCTEVDGKVFFTVEGKKPAVGDIIDVEITDYIDVDLIGEYKA